MTDYKTFYEVLVGMEAKDKEEFIDASGATWTFRIDKTGCMIECFLDKKNHFKYTEGHLKNCGVPAGFRRPLTLQERFAATYDALKVAEDTIKSSTELLKGLQVLMENHIPVLEENKGE